MTSSKLLHQIILPGVTIPGNIFLAPMAGYTDRAMREICSAFGADLTFTEMVSCEGLIRNNKRTTVLLDHDPAIESAFSVQLFTGNPQAAFDAVKKLEPYRPLLIDLNCGCPVPKVIKNGAGSALMRDTEMLGKIVAAMKEALEGRAGTAISVKLRTGWDDSEITYLEAAEAAQQAGAEMLTLHGRTRKQGYSGVSDRDAIKKLKENSSVPVIGSGDLFTADDVFGMLEATGCDGVMIARGAIGNPMIFEQIKTWPDIEPSDAKQRLAAAEKQIALAIAYRGEKRGCKEMRKHICAYSKGLQNGAALRNKIVTAKHSSEYLHYFDEFLGS